MVSKGRLGSHLLAACAVIGQSLCIVVAQMPCNVLMYDNHLSKESPPGWS